MPSSPHAAGLPSSAEAPSRPAPRPRSLAAIGSLRRQDVGERCLPRASRVPGWPRGGDAPSRLENGLGEYFAGRGIRRGTPSATSPALPMDSVRYFEFDFAWKATRRLLADDYVDVSSPRLLPVAVVLDRPTSRQPREPRHPRSGDDPRARRCAWIGDRCRWSAGWIRWSCPPRLIWSHRSRWWSTSPRPRCRGRRPHVELGAARWPTRPDRSVRAGGLEEYVDRDDYGLLRPDEAGFVLGQRFYDREALDAGFFRICGPAGMAIFGERNGDVFRRSRAQDARRGTPGAGTISVAAGYRRSRYRRAPRDRGHRHGIREVPGQLTLSIGSVRVVAAGAAEPAWRGWLSPCSQSFGPTSCPSSSSPAKT